MQSTLMYGESGVVMEVVVWSESSAGCDGDDGGRDDVRRE